MLKPSSIIGTQVFSPEYHFGSKGALLSAAEEMIKMGSNIIKFELNPRGYPEMSDKNLTQLQAVKSDLYRQIFDMPFTYYIMWYHPQQKGVGWTTQRRLEIYNEVYNISEYLLKEYSDRGKCFLIGNWEGDWLALNGNTKHNKDTDSVYLEYYGAVFNTMQEAVENARNAIAHKNTYLAHYIEVNLVLDAKDYGLNRLVNSVLPHIRTDAVSYSCYDSLQLSRLTEALDYIEKNAKFTDYFDGIFSKKVFIGEYDAYTGDYNKICAAIRPAEQLQHVHSTVLSAFSWGCPFILYWQMYNNVNESSGVYYLIDKSGKKSKVYYRLKLYIKAIKSIQKQFKRLAGRSINMNELSKFALLFNIRDKQSFIQKFVELYDVLKEAELL